MLFRSDKAESFNNCGGPLGAEVRGALYDLDVRPKTINYVYGLGGRDFRVQDCETIFEALDEVVRTGETGHDALQDEAS